MANCNHCGNGNPDEARFCENCGKPINAQNPIAPPAPTQGTFTSAPPTPPTAPVQGAFSSAPPTPPTAPAQGAFSSAPPSPPTAPAQGGFSSAPPSPPAAPAQGGFSSAPPSPPAAPAQGGFSSAPPTPPTAPAQGGFSSAPPTPPAAPAQGGFSSAPPTPPTAPAQGGFSSAPPTPPTAPAQGGFSSAPPPTFSQPAPSVYSQAPTAKPKSKKPLIIILIVVGVLLLSAIGGAILLITLFVSNADSFEEDTLPIINSTAGILPEILPSDDPDTDNYSTTPVGDNEITLSNESNVTIYTAYLSLSTDSEWGDDVLGSEIISSGDNLVISLPSGSGTYDLKIDDPDGNSYEFYELLLDPGETLVFTETNGGTIEHYLSGGSLYQEVAASGAAGSTTGNDGNNTGDVPSASTTGLIVSNDHSETVMYMYLSPSTEDTWGDDVLGTEVLSPGDYMNFDVNPGTSYDIKIEYSSGDSYEYYGITMTGVDVIGILDGSGGPVLLQVDADGNTIEHTAN